MKWPCASGVAAYHLLASPPPSANPFFRDLLMTLDRPCRYSLPLAFCAENVARPLASASMARCARVSGGQGYNSTLFWNRSNNIKAGVIETPADSKPLLGGGGVTRQAGGCGVLVGMRGFEPPASASRTLRSSQTEPHPDNEEGIYTAMLCLASPKRSFSGKNLFSSEELPNRGFQGA